MTNTLATLNEICLDAMREVGNIGLGNAMTALSTMVNEGVQMSVPKVGLIPLSEFTELAGGADAISVCIYMPVVDVAPGHVAFFLPMSSARFLADRLLGLLPGTTQEFDELSCSALLETGNILASSYLAAICELTGLHLLSTPPALAVDMTAAILASIASTFAATNDQALTILTHIGEPDSEVEGVFIYVPEPDSLATLLHALGLQDVYQAA